MREIDHLHAVRLAELELQVRRELLEEIKRTEDPHPSGDNLALRKRLDHTPFAVQQALAVAGTVVVGLDVYPSSRIVRHEHFAVANEPERRHALELLPTVVGEGDAGHGHGSDPLQHSRNLRLQQSLEGVLHSCVILRVVAAHHHEGVHSHLAPQPEKDGSRKQRRRVAVPVLGLDLVLLVVRVPLLKICDNEDVPFFESGGHLVEGHWLQLELTPMRENTAQDAFTLCEEVVHRAYSPHHCIHARIHNAGVRNERATFSLCG